MSKPWFIYVLFDPRISSARESVRYVGSTVDPASRHCDHIDEALGKSWCNTYKCRWILKVLRDRTRPEIRVVDVGSDESLRGSTETYWIQFYRYEVGANLTDLKEEARGYKFTPEQLKRLSDSHKGKSPPRSAIENSANKHRGKQGRKHTDEERRLISIAQIGTKRSDESRKHSSDAVKAWWQRRKLAGLSKAS